MIFTVINQIKSYYSSNKIEYKKCIFSDFVTSMNLYHIKTATFVRDKYHLNLTHGNDINKKG